MKRKRTKRESKPVAYKDDTWAIESDLPFPVVLYPSYYGTYFAFKKNVEDSDMYLCSCTQKSIQNFLELLKISNDYDSNKLIHYRNEFPLQFLSLFPENKIPDYEDFLPFFRDGICHSCNDVIPSYDYCIPMYGSRFKREHGWYINQRKYEFGIDFPDFLYSELPSDIYNLATSYSQLIAVEKLSPEQSSELSRYYTDICRYIENSIRQQWGHYLIGQRWLSETNLYTIVVSLFGKENVIFHYRPPWLEGLELDIFLVHYNLGIEYQGLQHFVPLKHWGGQSGYQKRIEHDQKKKVLCAKADVRIVYFSYKDVISTELVLERLSDIVKNS